MGAHSLRHEKRQAPVCLRFRPKTPPKRGKRDAAIQRISAARKKKNAAAAQLRLPDRAIGNMQQSWLSTPPLFALLSQLGTQRTRRGGRPSAGDAANPGARQSAAARRWGR